MEKIHKILLYWLPALLWSLLIFQFSSRTLPSVTEFYWPDFIAKKTAHVIEYAILYLLIYRATKNTTKLKLRDIAIVSLLLLFVYAITDEFHQTFIPTRTGRLRDVFIDSGGGLMALFALWKLLPTAPQKLKNWAKKLQLV
jgi:VanZ family protein